MAVWAVCPFTAGAATATIRLRKSRFFIIQQITSELRRVFPVGSSEPLYLIHLCLLNHCRSR
jgi:hypothetical protein